MKCLIKALFAGCLLASSSQTVNAAPVETPPVPGEAKNFVVPAGTRFILDNGLNVTLVPYGSVPKATIYMHFDAGNLWDDKVWGMSDLVFDMITRGTDTASAGELASQAASMGGQLQSGAGFNASSLSIDVLSEHAPEAVKLLADVLTHSTFNADDLEKVKATQWRNVEIARSRAQSQASEAFMQALYGDTTLGQYFPEHDAFMAVSQQQVKDYVASTLVAKRAHLYVAGVYDEKALMSSITTAFAHMPAGMAAEKVDVSKTANQPAYTLIPRQNAPQSTIRLGQRVVPITHNDTTSLDVMNTMLGGMFSSRITRNIREEKGYTYSPYSQLRANRGTSYWYEAADIQSESTGEALNEIIKEIATIQTTPPSAEELQGVKNYMAGIFVLNNSSRMGLISQLVKLSVYDLPGDSLTQYISHINNVSAEQVSQAAKTHLALDNMSLIIVGDEAQIAEELESVHGLPVLTN